MSTILDQFRLDNKVAIVTGAARGLGQGIALALAEAGANIVAVSQTPSEETVAQVRRLGRKAVAVACDLGDRSAVPRVIAEARRNFDSLDILVNCAGIIRRDDFLSFSEGDWDDVVNVNMNAVFFLCQAFCNDVIARGGKGKIINIASMLTFQGGIRVASYTATKSAMAGLTRLIANELAGKGIHCNAIAPGYMATDNTAALRADEKRSAAILERIPQGRWGTPDDLKGAAVFLASAASDYVNGYTLAVDGGWLGR